jgi:hypothetical protein
MIKRTGKAVFFKSAIQAFYKVASGLMLSSAALCLIFVLVSSEAPCAEGDDFLISLPTNKTEAKPKASSSTTQKKETTDSASKTETMLQGVFYDLKQMKNRQPNKGVSEAAKGDSLPSESVAPIVKIVQNFVNGTWQKTYDRSGRVSYTALDQYYCSPTRLWNTMFYTGERIDSKKAPQLFMRENEVKPFAWVCIYSGYVVAPFSGKFRFVGFGDDFLVIRFKEKIVFDFGEYSATLGTALDENMIAKLKQTSAPAAQNKKSIGRVMPSASNIVPNTLYSTMKLETCYQDKYSPLPRGVGKGAILEVKKGEVIPIEILMGDLDDNFCYALLYERLDNNAKSSTMFLFRTSSAFPEGKTSSLFPFGFSNNSPVWNVVNSKGRPIPSHAEPAAAKKTDAASDKDKDKDKTPSAVSSQPKSNAESSTAIRQSDPKPKRTVSRTKRGNVTTETVIEQNGDTTVETVTTTEVDGDTTVETVTTTETKNGAVVKKTTTTKTTTTSTQTSETNEEPDSDSSSESSATKPSSGSKTDSSTNKEKYNPFGTTQP